MYVSVCVNLYGCVSVVYSQPYINKSLYRLATSVRLCFAEI